MSVNDDPIARALATSQKAKPVAAKAAGSSYGRNGTANAREAPGPEPCFRVLDESMAVTLDLEMRSGDREAYPYSLLSRIAFDRSEGITLEYVGAKVEISGSRLDELYKALCGHRVLRIVEARDGFEADNGGAFVESIEVSAV